ncbi:hypothetical protein [Glacieibacterium frigidum]|uniref:Lipoprotein n=1 Tax=Glacieibacterium frigidum TaxID=2593303 RepID=A0A552UAK0_9SPHN|nr:hypothetical protein [Glacieibacterium frigidum]TRW15250.1 hypothetical protein FMM06_16625 [Glacieibacterium frigidum]
MTRFAWLGGAAVVAAAAGVALLSGCALTPRVDYHGLADAARADNWVPYALTDTTIAIGTGEALGDKLSLARATPACDETGCEPAIAAVAVPIAFDGELLALAPRSRPLISTEISPTYWPDSLRLKVLTVEAKDHTLEAITAVGTIVTGAAKLGGMRSADEDDGVELQLPLIIDLADAKKALGKAQPLPDNPGWTMEARFTDRPPGQAGFLARADRGRVHNALLTSICRPLRLELKYGETKTIVTVTVRVADPDWLVAIPFPAKGSLTLHPLCGADVQAQPVTRVTADKVAETLFAQVEAVRAAR